MLCRQGAHLLGPAATHQAIGAWAPAPSEALVQVIALFWQCPAQPLTAHHDICQPAQHRHWTASADQGYQQPD